MTTIRDPSIAPPVEGEFRKLDKAVTRRRLVVLLGASALVLTAVNLTASVYLLRATSELRAIDTRLQDLAGLEKRLKESLNVVNTGIQTTLGNLDRDIHSKITDLEDGVGGLQRLFEQPVNAAVLPEPSQEPDAAVTSATLPEAADEAVAAEPPADVPVADIQPPKRRKPSPPPVSKIGSSYQRIESADGKVYYRRVH